MSTTFDEFDLLDQLGTADRERVADELEAEDLAAGVELFREGEASNGAVWLGSGRVRVHRSGLGQAAELASGEVLGTLALVVDGPREASAETLSRVRIWRLSRSAYRRLVAAAPRTAGHLVEVILRAYADSVRRELRPPNPNRGDGAA